MKVFTENENLRVVETIGNYMERRYEVYRHYYYYSEVAERIVYDWYQVYNSHDLKSCMDYFEKYKDDIYEKRETVDMLEYALSMWS